MTLRISPEPVGYHTDTARLTTTSYFFPTLYHAFVFALFQSLSYHLLVRASPLRSDAGQDIPLPLTKRDDSPNAVPPAILTPALIILVVFVCLAVLSCLGRALLRRTHARHVANATATENTVGTAVLTAAQLAGTINGDAGGGNATRRPRRPRRPRRTPSQMSVTSLPEYMKEPGEEELVIFRGQNPDPEGADAMPQPAATVVVEQPSDDEDGEQPGQTHPSQTGEHGSEDYTHIPTSPNTTPLLEEQDPRRSSGRALSQNDSVHDDSDVSMQEIPLQVSTSRQSRLSDTSSELNSLRRFDSNNTQASMPVARAPPAYIEVIGDDEPLRAYYPPLSSATLVSSTASTTSPLLAVSSTSTSALAQPPPSSANQSRNRHSGIRTFFNRMSMSMPLGGSNGTSNRGGTSRSGGHQHQYSDSSILTNPARPPSSTSFFRRPRSSYSHSVNQSSTSLTSPSMISLSSISAPLTHTASRTKFTFPNSKTTGLPTMTPEQVRIIAAREAIGKFGVPYGPDAVAFAAAASFSRVELGGVEGMPPPGFEDVVGEPSRPGLPTSGAGGFGGSMMEQEEVEESLPHELPTMLGGSVSVAGVGSSRSTRDHNDETSPPEIESQIPKLDLPLDPSTSESSPSATPSSSTHANVIKVSTSTCSEFGQIAVAPDKNANINLLRAESISSVYSSRTYATAPESFVPLSPSFSNFPSIPRPRLEVRSAVGDEERSVDEGPRIGSDRRVVVV